VIPATHLTDEQAQMHLEGLLPADEAPAVSSHLRECPECQALVLSFEALQQALSALPAAEPPGDFTAGVMARIDERERASARERRVALAVLGVVGLGAGTALALAGQGAWAPVLSGASARLAQALQALRISGDVLSPIVGALRVQIAVACAALGLPLLLGLAQLVPARSHRAA
jgi:anti-sigma factor RsiW